MTPEVIAAITAQAIFNVSVVFALLWCRRELKNYRRMVRVMTADSHAVPTSPELIEEWAEKYRSLPEGSPKWLAYRNRLIEVGHLKQQ